YKPQNLAGTSAGAIVAALIAAEYTPAEIYQTIFNLDFKALMDPTPLVGSRNRGGTVAALLRLLQHHGINEGEALRKELANQYGKKQIRTFGQFRLTSDSQTDARYQHKLQVIVSDVTARRLIR